MSRRDRTKDSTPWRDPNRDSTSRRGRNPGNHFVRESSGRGGRGGASGSRNYNDDNHRSNDRWASTHGRRQPYERDQQPNANNRNYPSYQNRTDDHPEASTKRPMRQMGFKLIQSLLDNADLEDIIFQLTNEKKGFKQLLENTDIKSDMVVLLIKLLSKICAFDFKSSLIRIFETMFVSPFGEALVNYISKIPLQDYL